MRKNLKAARKAAGLTQQTMPDTERLKRAKADWFEANQKLLHYQAQAYFALLDILDTNGLL